MVANTASWDLPIKARWAAPVSDLALRVPGPFQTCRRPGDPVISGGRSQTMNVWQKEETTHIPQEMQRRFPLFFGQVGGRPVPSWIGIAE